MGSVLAEATSTVETTQSRSLQIFKVIRILRTMRIVRVASFVRALRVLAWSIINTVRSMIWSVLLMLMIFYGFGIVFTQAIVQAGDLDVEADFIRDLHRSWGTLPRSMFSLLQSISGGVSWEDLVFPLAQISWILVAVFLCFFVFTYFVVLNVMTGAFCSSAIQSAHRDRDLATLEMLANKKLWMDAFRGVFDEIDMNSDSEIDLKEF